MENNLIGTWKNSPDDLLSFQVYGDIEMEFKESGKLIYRIFNDKKIQIIVLNYRIEGNTIITDQPSHSETVRSQFSIEDDALALTLDGIKTNYVRVIY